MINIITLVFIFILCIWVIIFSVLKMDDDYPIKKPTVAVFSRLLYYKFVCSTSIYTLINIANDLWEKI
jgi:hypothetical protein